MFFVRTTTHVPVEWNGAAEEHFQQAFAFLEKLFGILNHPGSLFGSGVVGCWSPAVLFGSSVSSTCVIFGAPAAKTNPLSLEYPAILGHRPCPPLAICCLNMPSIAHDALPAAAATAAKFGLLKSTSRACRYLPLLFSVWCRLGSLPFARILPRASSSTVSGTASVLSL